MKKRNYNINIPFEGKCRERTVKTQPDEKKTQRTREKRVSIGNKRMKRRGVRESK